jgi:hypothetical protein
MSMPHDAGHAAFEHAFRAGLGAGPLPEGLTAPDMDEVPRRFAVYRNNVHHSLSRALAARFPVVEMIVGAQFFSALARAFIAQHPPRDPVLQQWGGAFAEFLDGFAPVAQLPWLGDVARLEFARGRACHAADAQPVPPEALATETPEHLRLGLHPSAELFVSRHPAVSIWQAHQPDGQPGAPLPAGPEYALVARAPDFTVIVAAIDVESHAVIAAIAAGQPLGIAAEGTDPTAALMLLLQHGLITELDTGDAP